MGLPVRGSRDHRFEDAEGGGLPASPAGSRPSLAAMATSPARLGGLPQRRAARHSAAMRGLDRRLRLREGCVSEVSGGRGAWDNPSAGGRRRVASHGLDRQLRMGYGRASGASSPQGCGTVCLGEDRQKVEGDTRVARSVLALPIHLAGYIPPATRDLQSLDRWQPVD